MTTRLFSLVVVALVSAASASARAQATRRRVPAGEVTGLEMAIEGSLSATAGSNARWFVTLYEVLRHRDLRARAGATLRVTSALTPGAPVAEVTTDSHGRASFEVPIPASAESGTEIRVTAIAGGVQRVFRAPLRLLPRYAVELYTDRTQLAPGARVAVFGRVLEEATGRPASGVTVHVRGTAPRARGSAYRPAGWEGVIAPVELESGASGVFHTEIGALETPGQLTITASTESGQAAVELRVVEPEAPPVLLLHGRVLDLAGATLQVLSPGQRASIDVELRDPRGVPVRGATVALVEDDEVSARTDARGRARLPWRAPTIAAPFVDREVAVRATDPARGVVSARVPIRIAARAGYSALVAAGGMLVPGMENVLFARAVDPRGAPLAGQDVQLSGAAIGDHTARTDADGFATFRVTVQAPSEPGRCGGTAIDVQLRRGSEQDAACLPLDPDASVIVDPQPITGGFEIGLARAPNVAGRPLSVMALERRGESWVPIARALAPADARTLTMPLPPGRHAIVWFRARPLLSDGRTVAGGGALAWRGPTGAAPSLDVQQDGASGAGSSAGVSFIFASEHGDSGFSDPRGALGARLDSPSGSWLSAELAALTPRDLAASSVRRERTVLPQAMPESPVRLGLLRDPWRARARFVRGRLARVLRAVEAHVGEAIPHVGQVAHRERGRWRFNSEVLRAALGSQALGEEGASGLDGDPLDLDALVALDPAFTFDNVARRVTRERLWRLALRLREVVRERGLDREWARLGDPRLILPALRDSEIRHNGGVADRAQLYDAWGRPFVLVPSRGPQAFLDPLPGWRLVSPGPDGRPGNRDDLSDPLARVLPARGLYAEAVDEDLLVARLQSVARSRASVAALSEIFEQSEITRAPVRLAEWASLPRALRPRPARWLVTAPAERPRGGAGEQVRWARVGAERPVRVTHVRFGEDGGVAEATQRTTLGIPWNAHVSLPETLRVGDRLRLPIALGRHADGPPPPLVAEVEGRGVTARVEGEELVLEATSPGLATVRVALRVEGAVRESSAQRVRVVPDGSLRARHSGGRASAEEPAEITLAPVDGDLLRGRLILVGARDLSRDPGLARGVAAHPAIAAWAETLRDGAPSPEQLAAARAAHVEDPLEVACLLLADAAEGSRRSATRTRQLATELHRRLPEGLRARAAMHAALATLTGDSRRVDTEPESLIDELSRNGWRALATTTENPAEMARVAAALLIGDPDDGPGRALLERATERTVERGDAREVPGPGTEGFVGTLALAIAARQVGEHALADALARGAARRLYLAGRLDSEGLFWSLAASVHGAFGIEEPGDVWVEIDGARHAVTLSDGVAELPLPTDSREVRVGASGPLMARSELRYLAPYIERRRGPLRARIEGSTGSAPGRAALELVLENASESTVETPVLELTVPSAGRLDEQARRSMRSSEAVRAVRAPDGAGRSRLVFTPLEGGQTVRVPLPLAWIASGRTRGLGVITYDGSRPAARATLAERTLELSATPDTEEER